MKNADTIKIGGNQHDCGPKMLKKAGLDKNKGKIDSFIKRDTDSESLIDGFETALKKISFK